MNKSVSCQMTLRELGHRKLSSFVDAPIPFSQLHPDFPLPRKWRNSVPKGVKLRNPLLRFLIKVHDGVDNNALLQAIQQSFGASDAMLTDKQRIVDNLRLSSLATIRHAKSSWWLLELPVSLGSFLNDTRFDLKQLQGLAKQLAVTKYIDDAEADAPYVNLVFPQQEHIPGCTVGSQNAPRDYFWSQRLVNLLDDSDNRTITEDGQGIRLGMIDTGYTLHAELDVNSTYDVSASTSVIDASSGLDPMPSGTSHGTATGSLITSAQRQGDTADRVVGIAPGVTVISVRALDFVVVAPVGDVDPLVGELVETFFPSDILSALQKCIDLGCHVINMSFGGIVSQAIRDLVTEAYNREIILCAAAGNCVRFVVEPAARPEVVACAAVGLDPSTGTPRPWTGTSRGPQVDISAPGENVYVADWHGGNQVVRPGEGTSFAAPHLAAAAAVWLQKHGINQLRNRYNGICRLADVFRRVVRESATVPGNWNSREFGAGILNLRGCSIIRSPRRQIRKARSRTGLLAL